MPSLQARQAVTAPFQSTEPKSLCVENKSLWLTDVSLGVPVAIPGTHRQSSFTSHLWFELSKADNAGRYCGAVLWFVVWRLDNL